MPNVDEYRTIKEALDGLKLHYDIYSKQKRGGKYGVSVAPEELEPLKILAINAFEEAQSAALHVDLLHADVLSDSERKAFMQDLDDMNLLLLDKAWPMAQDSVDKLREIASRLVEKNKSCEVSLKNHADHPLIKMRPGLSVRRYQSIRAFERELGNTIQAAIGNVPDAAPVTTSASAPQVTGMAPPSENPSAPIVVPPSNTTSTNHSSISPVSSVFSHPGNGGSQASSVSSHDTNSNSASGGSPNSMRRAKDILARLLGKG